MKKIFTFIIILIYGFDTLHGAGYIQRCEGHAAVEMNAETSGATGYSTDQVAYADNNPQYDVTSPSCKDDCGKVNLRNNSKKFQTAVQPRSLAEAVYFNASRCGHKCFSTTQNSFVADAAPAVAGEIPLFIFNCSYRL